MSKAYHSTFKKMKPRKKEKGYRKKMQEALVAARRAYRLAGLEFDEANPRSSSSGSKKRPAAAFSADTKKKDEKKQATGKTGKIHGANKTASSSTCEPVVVATKTSMEDEQAEEERPMSEDPVVEC